MLVQSSIKHPLYTVRKEAKYDRQIHEIAESYARMDELELAIDWHLSRNPRGEVELDFKDYYIYKTDEVTGFPMLRIVYHVNDEEQLVTCLIVEQTEND